MRYLLKKSFRNSLSLYKQDNINTKFMNVKKYLRITWLFAILTMVTFPFIFVLAESLSLAEAIILGFAGMFVVILGILSVAFIISVRNGLSQKQKKPFLMLAVLSGLLLLFALLFSPPNIYQVYM